MKSMILHSYLPQDRLGALMRGETLPLRTCGSALFADISGFTALTETLRNALGARQGAEELTKHLDTVYTALITVVEDAGGSVVGFAGDAITCWFDGPEDSALRAVHCALALQSAMDAFKSVDLAHEKTTALSLKVSVATGVARRFVVGDPAIHCMDVLAGATVARTSLADQLAHKGEVLADEATVQALGDVLAIQAWRSAGSGERFARVLDLAAQRISPSPTAHHPALETEQLRPWMQPTVYERFSAGQGSFLTEFRPCAVLFVKFAGIDYDADDAQARMDAFIRLMQKVAIRYEGSILQLSTGDKGSYAYLNFGALAAHEDDARRAVKAALELRDRSDLQLQMGITQGLLRVGAYGGATRKTFGALGDDVNLAARLMMTAPVGEILLSGRAHKAVANDFVCEPRSPLPMKGKAEPLPVFAVTGKSHKRAIRLQEPTYALPMVGRRDELKLVDEKLGLAAEGQGQVVAVVAEAGMGKSRLLAEVIRSARKKGFVGYGGACQSDAIHTPYHTWKSVWGAFFGVDDEQPLRKVMRSLAAEIDDRAPSRLQAMPLLNVILDLAIPENEFTRNLEPKTRQSALHALLEDVLKAASSDEPLLIVIEDLHWADAPSYQLLKQLARALASYPVCFVLAYRPPQLARLALPRLEALPQFTKIELNELTQAEATLAIRAKLAQLYPARGGALPAVLVDALMARAQGNPFYLEELLNYLRDRGLNPADIENIELPDSLHTLILSRIDQLHESEKTTLRVASIVGRLFRVQWLTGCYPELGTFPQVKASLDTLQLLDITPLDSPEPELAYLFKHIVTHEVTYESLPFATRAKLHEQLARYLEGAHPEALPLEALAFHYGRSANAAKQSEYLGKAGDAAQRNFANDGALNHYGKLLPLLNDRQEKATIHLKRAEVLKRVGDFVGAESDYRAALELVQDDLAMTASAQFELGKLNRLRGDYAQALEWLAQANKLRTRLEDKEGLARVLIETGIVSFRKGAYGQAREPLNAGLALAREAGDNVGAATALNCLGNLAAYDGHYAEAEALYGESLSCRREMGDKKGISDSLSNLGFVAQALGDSAAAKAFYEEALNLVREMGDRQGIGNSLNYLGGLALEDSNHAAARALIEEGLGLLREIGAKNGLSWSLRNLGTLDMAQGDNAAARTSLEESLALCMEIDDRRSMAYTLLYLGLVDHAEHKPEARERILASLRLGVELAEPYQQLSSLAGLAGVAFQAGDAAEAARILGAVATMLKALDMVLEIEVRHLHAKTLAAVQAQLDERAFESAWDEGSQCSLDEAAQRALAP
jgi:class 3 adenylate cyclase/tetratricopeptide (TPR) repeat protein